jgi:hypothetical protein
VPAGGDALWSRIGEAGRGCLSLATEFGAVGRRGSAVEAKSDRGRAGVSKGFKVFQLSA